MKKDLTELVFILDRSGSMSGLEKDTIGGYNAMLAKQKHKVGNAAVTTVLFDDDYEVLHDRIQINGVQPINDKQYFVRGSTALLDAVGKTILKIANVQKNTLEEERAEKVLFVITTDGQENSSHEFSYDRIKSMIEKQKTEHKWEFIFLGANIDAAKEAAKFGIASDHTAQFHNDSEGVALNYAVVSEAVSAIRSGKQLSKHWKKEIEEDFKNRKA